MISSRPIILGSALALGHAGCGKCGDELTFTNENNYSYEPPIVDIPVVETAANVDIEICFDALTNDIQCHETDPAADIVNVGMSRWDLTPAEINDAIANDTLRASDAQGYVDVRTDPDRDGEGVTCIHTADMSFGKTKIDVKEEYYVGPTYLVFAADTTQPAVGSRGLVMLVPTKDSDVTHVEMKSQCGKLVFTADLTSLSSPSVCPKGDTKVDWGDVDTNGLGDPFTPSSVDELLLAHYEDMTAADLEENFLDLELLADEKWTLNLFGDVKANLKDATTGADGAGDKFSGFEDSGLYVLALFQTNSPNPAPKFLTVLTPE